MVLNAYLMTDLGHDKTYQAFAAHKMSDSNDIVMTKRTRISDSCRIYKIAIFIETVWFLLKTGKPLSC